MQTCSMTFQQLSATDTNEFDNMLLPGSVGAILYEIAPGASFLSQQQIGNVMREASKHFRRGCTSDLTISVERDGTVSYRVDMP